MENVRLTAVKLHDSLLVAETFHAEAAVEALLKDQRAKRHGLELAEGVGAATNTRSIKPTHVAEGQK